MIGGYIKFRQEKIKEAKAKGLAILLSLTDGSAWDWKGDPNWYVEISALLKDNCDASVPGDVSKTLFPKEIYFKPYYLEYVYETEDGVGMYKQTNPSTEMLEAIEKSRVFEEVCEEFTSATVKATCEYIHW